MRDYSAMTALIATKLQSAGTMDFSVAEMDSQIEDCLKELSSYQAHLIPIVFKIESRYGTCSTTSANNLVDTTKGQFLADDHTKEKVVHNVTDDTWAVIASYAGTSSVGVSLDIFQEDDQYRIYNKRCWNQKQIFIGDLTDWGKIGSVEYPIGAKRNWEILGNEILELKVDTVEDSNSGSTVTTEPIVNVLVRFNRAHVLCQLTDLSARFASTTVAGDTVLLAGSLQASGTIEAGDEFYIGSQRPIYVVRADTVITANTATISFYPPLEDTVTSTATVITFVKSSLLQQQEDVFADLVAARLAINKPLYSTAQSKLVLAGSALVAGTAYINTVNVGGDVAGQYRAYAQADMALAIGYERNWRILREWGERKLAETLRKLQGQTRPRVKKVYSRE